MSQIRNIEYSGERGQLEIIVTDYNSQVRAGTIKPKLIEDLTLDDFRFGGIIVSTDDEGNYDGLAIYRLLKAENIEEFAKYFSACFGDTLFDAHGREVTESILLNSEILNTFAFKCPIMYLLNLESFREGTERKLIEAAKSSSIGGIFLQIGVPGTKGFFEKTGFKETGWYVGNEYPVMIWMGPS